MKALRNLIWVAKDIAASGRPLARAKFYWHTRHGKLDDAMLVAMAAKAAKD